MTTRTHPPLDAQEDEVLRDPDTTLGPSIPAATPSPVRVSGCTVTTFIHRSNQGAESLTPLTLADQAAAQARPPRAGWIVSYFRFGAIVCLDPKCVLMMNPHQRRWERSICDTSLLVMV